LRLELLAVCRRFDLPDHLFLTWDGWKRFFMPLAEEISGRVMTVDELPGLRKKLLDAPVQGGRTLETVRLLVAVNWPEVPYWWSFEANDTTKIVIPVRFGERELKDGPTPSGWVSPLD
jgi:hypothetical protein